jgi:hypothetical protein
MSGLGHVLNRTPLWRDFHYDVCLRSLQRQGFRCAAQGTRAKWKEIQCLQSVVAAALAVAALLAGGVAATETAAGAGRGINHSAGRGI